MSPVNELERQIKSGTLDEAMQTLKALDAGEEQKLYYTALIAFKRDRYDEAIDLAEKLIKRDDGESRAQALLGQALGLKAQNSGPVKGALLLPRVKKAFSKALELDEANLEALQGLFMYYLFSPAVAGGDEKRALELIEKTMTISEAHAWLMQGIYHSKKDEKDKAMEAFGKAAALCGEEPDILLRSARFFLEQKAADKARETVEKYMRLLPGTPAGLELQADLNRQEARWDMAAEGYRRVLDINGHYFPARYKLALCLKESGNSAAARQELEKLQKDHPKSPVRARVEALLKELS